MEDCKLKVGYRVDGRWQVVRKLGAGAFGAVYEAEDVQLKLKGCKALKLESVRSKDQVLKIEVAVLRALQGTNHVCRLYACGRNDRFNFMLMSLLGPSLATLRKKAPDQKFSTTTAVNVSMQCLQSLLDMHKAGWLHRDVKPSNFAMGPPDDADTKRNVYVLDFGLSRNYLHSDGRLREPRDQCGFRGTLRYCSLNGHRGKELGRSDDLMSLLYMFLEMLKGSLPWKAFNTNHEVRDSKEQTGDKLYEHLPASFKQLDEHLNKVEYDEAPKKEMFEMALFDLLTKDGGDTNTYLTAPLDWEVPKEDLKKGSRKSKKEKGDDQPASEGPKFDEAAQPNNAPEEQVAELPKSQYRELNKKPPP